MKEVFYKFNPKGNDSDIREFVHPELNNEIEAKILIESSINGDIFDEPRIIRFNEIPVVSSGGRFVSQYENALQGFIYYSLRKNLFNIRESLKLQNISQLLLEVPLLKAQQFRSDILCLFQRENKKPHFYSIIEIKRDSLININDLAQLMGYLKTFAESNLLSFSSLEGLYISNDFTDDSIQYLMYRKSIENENPISLTKYTTNENGNVNFERIEI